MKALDDILKHFRQRSWGAILKTLVDTGYVPPKEADIVLTRVNQRAKELAVLAETTLHDQALKSVELAIQEGLAPDEFKAKAKEKLAPSMGQPARRFRDTHNKHSMVSTIVASDLQTPYNEQRVERQLRDADDVADDVPPGEPPEGGGPGEPGAAETFFLFTAVLDDRTTEICQSLDGTMLPVDDPFWADNSPPLHPNCRSTLVSYGGREAGKIGITSRPEEGQYVPPDQGWGASEFRYQTALSGKDSMLEAIARAKVRNPLW